jgi:hypothetical protein
MRFIVVALTGLAAIVSAQDCGSVGQSCSNGDTALCCESSNDQSGGYTTCVNGVWVYTDCGSFAGCIGLVGASPICSP